MKVFQYNISFAWNYFYKRRFNFHLLADAIVPSNIKAAVKLQRSMANEDSSNVNEIIKAILNFFIFFFTKRFYPHTTYISKQKQKRQRFYAHKKYLRGRKSLIRLFLFLCFLCFWCLQNLFVKKIKRLITAWRSHLHYYWIHPITNIKLFYNIIFWLPQSFSIITIFFITIKIFFITLFFDYHNLFQSIQSFLSQSK